MAPPPVRVRATGVDGGAPVEYESISAAALSVLVNEGTLTHRNRTKRVIYAMENQTVLDGRTWTRVAAPTAPQAPREEVPFVFPDDVHERFRGKKIRAITNPPRYRAMDMLSAVGGLRNPLQTMRVLVVAHPEFFRTHTEVHAFRDKPDAPSLVLSAVAAIAFIGFITNDTADLFRQTTLARFARDIGVALLDAPDVPDALAANGDAKDDDEDDENEDEEDEEEDAAEAGEDDNEADEAEDGPGDGGDEDGENEVLAVADSAFTPDHVLFNGKLIRATREVPRRVSVFDLITAVSGIARGRNVFYEMVRVYPEVALNASNLTFQGAGQRQTPVTGAEGVVTIINLLPGANAARFRASGAKLLVRYMGGDETLVHEIRAIADANVAPDGMEGLFREAVQQQQAPQQRRRALPVLDALRLLGLHPEDAALVDELIALSHAFVASKCIGKHVMYFCITNIRSPEFPGRLVVKIGYTADLTSRMAALLTEYKCELMFLVGAMPVPNEQFEKTFHRMMSARFPHAVCDIKIGGVAKDELYLCDRGIIREFFGLMEPDEPPPPSVELLLSREQTARERERTRQMEIHLNMLRLSADYSME